MMKNVRLTLLPVLMVVACKTPNKDSQALSQYEGQVGKEWATIFRDQFDPECEEEDSPWVLVKRVERAMGRIGVGNNRSELLKAVNDTSSVLAGRLVEMQNILKYGVVYGGDPMDVKEESVVVVTSELDSAVAVVKGGLVTGAAKLVQNPTDEAYDQVDSAIVRLKRHFTTIHTTLISFFQHDYEPLEFKWDPAANNLTDAFSLGGTNPPIVVNNQIFIEGLHGQGGSPTAIRLKLNGKKYSAFANVSVSYKQMPQGEEVSELAIDITLGSGKTHRCSVWHLPARGRENRLLAAIGAENDQYTSVPMESTLLMSITPNGLSCRVGGDTTRVNQTIEKDQIKAISINGGNVYVTGLQLDIAAPQGGGGSGGQPVVEPRILKNFVLSSDMEFRWGEARDDFNTAKEEFLVDIRSVFAEEKMVEQPQIVVPDPEEKSGAGDQKYLLAKPRISIKVAVPQGKRLVEKIIPGEIKEDDYPWRAAKKFLERCIEKITDQLDGSFVAGDCGQVDSATRSNRFGTFGYFSTDGIRIFVLENQ